MIKIRAVCFTQKGVDLLRKLNRGVAEANVSSASDSNTNSIAETGFKLQMFIKSDSIAEVDGFEKVNGELSDWVRAGFEQGDAILFVGAMGIAIRMIAPFVSDKLADSPVIVTDDNGIHVIPVLSGHVGRANEIAYLISDVLESDLVLTTATDVNDAFSVDNFAVENHLTIKNRDGIKKVNAKALEGKPITISVKNYPPAEAVDVLITDDETGADGNDINAHGNAVNACNDIFKKNDMQADIVLGIKKYVVGLGFKRGKSCEEIKHAVDAVLAEESISYEDVYAFATINIKEAEEGLQALSGKLRIPVIAFDAPMLQKAPGEFTASEFVAQTVGVDNVCERAAVLAANCGKLIRRKTAGDGVTVALAKRSI